MDADEAVPVVPQGEYRGKAKLKEGPPILTWPALMCGMAHFTPHSGHQNPAQMLDSLWGVVFWANRAQMAKYCSTLYYRCSNCTAHKKLPRSSARLKSVKSRRPFLRVQIDLYEVSPASKDGYRMVLTVHCVYNRYPFLRKLKTKTAAEVASALWDVILDMGVVPMYVQSDMGREFVNEMLGELSP